jgi:hypothetical protein
VRYSSSLRPCVPTKVRNVVEFASHGIEISCSWAVAPVEGGDGGGRCVWGVCVWGAWG